MLTMEGKNKDIHYFIYFTMLPPKANSKNTPKGTLVAWDETFSLRLELDSDSIVAVGAKSKVQNQFTDPNRLG
jgi:hypothetical protein